MCIITFHYQQHPRYKLIVAANRDEFYQRPTEAVHYWQDHPEVLAGRDLQAMGTWLGITKQGRFAALTNYRDPAEFHSQKRSRGAIVHNFLTGTMNAVDYLQVLEQEKDLYNGFNVVLGTVDELYYYSNKENIIRKIPPGTHSISNHLLNTPWPKVKRAKAMLANYVLQNEELEIANIFAQLEDRTLADDHELPDTGVGLALERQLSPIFIRTADYGTRSATVILVTHDNEVIFSERTYNAEKFKYARNYVLQINQK